MIQRPVELLRNVSDRNFYVVHQARPSTGVPHLPNWDRDRGHVAVGGLDLTRRLYTAILEAAWMVGETMDGSIGSGPEDEGKR